jgi:hypothetical protein
LRALRVRRFEVVGAGGGSIKFAQYAAICRAASFVARDAWRLMMASLLPRIVAAMVFAPLSHMLSSGLDFIHGFLIEYS